MLQPLREDDIVQFVAATLCIAPNEIVPLAAVIQVGAPLPPSPPNQPRSSEFIDTRQAGSDHGNGSKLMVLQY